MRLLQPPQRGQVVEPGPGAGRDEQVEAAACSASAFTGASPVPPPIRRSPRAEPGSRTMAPVGRPEQDGVAGSAVPHQGAAHPAGGARADVQAQRPVRAGRVGDGVGPPDAGPPGGLDAHVLAGQEGQRPLGAEGEDGEVVGAAVVGGDLGDPPGRVVGRVPLGGGDHGGGGGPVGAGPGVLGLGGPHVGGVGPQGGQQRGLDRGVVLAPDAVPAVAAAEAAEVAGEVGGAVLAPDDAGEGTEEAVVLLAHGGREQGAQLGFAREKAAVEIAHRARGVRLQTGEALLDDSRFR